MLRRQLRSVVSGLFCVYVCLLQDPIHPEYVLQAPFEVFAFQYNPSNPEIVAGGCYNGQVVLWDTTNEHERIARMKAASNKQDSQDASDEATIPIVKCKWVRHDVGHMVMRQSTSSPCLAVAGLPFVLMSALLASSVLNASHKCVFVSFLEGRYVTAIEFSHHSAIMDLQWLPGVEITSRGKLNKAGDGSRECSFLATTAGDGKINFWDIRVDRLMKKGRKAEDALDLVWKPTHSVHLISLIGECLAEAVVEIGTTASAVFILSWVRSALCCPACPAPHCCCDCVLVRHRHGPWWHAHVFPPAFTGHQPRVFHRQRGW